MFDVCSNTNSLLERYTSNLKRSALEETTEQKVVDAFSWKSLEIFLLYTTTKAFLSWLKKSPRFAIHKIYPRLVVTQLIDRIRLIRKSSKSNLLELRAKGGLGLKLFSGKRPSIMKRILLDSWSSTRKTNIDNNDYINRYLGDCYIQNCAIEKVWNGITGLNIYQLLVAESLRNSFKLM